jgi:mono/diheme cytochrome c family protein
MYGVRSAIPAVAIALLLALTGCKPRHNMERQPYYKPYEPSEFFNDGTSARPLVAGVVPRPADQSPGIPYVTVFSSGPAGYPTTAPSRDIPFAVTRDKLQRGQQLFAIYCSMCHGRLGDGAGMVPQRGLVHPPSYHLERLREAPDSHFFNVMSNGFGAMYSYAERVSPEDRWLIVAYIRALQKGVQQATDLTPAQRKELAGTRP